MGVIQRQTIKGTIYAYIGVVIAFITTAWFFPKFLAKDQIGLTRLLVSYALIFAQFSTLGFTNVAMRLFPYFRNIEERNKGFLKLSVLVTLAGFTLICCVFFALKSFIIRNESSELFTRYMIYILPLTFFFAYFNIFEAYNRVIYDSVTGIFLREFFQRFLILVSILIYVLKWIDFGGFVIAYVLSLCIPTVLLVARIKQHGQLFLTGKIAPINQHFRREIVNVSFYGIMQGFGLIAITNIDVVMVSWFASLEQVGIYATSVIFGILIVIPSRPLMKISSTILAEAWKDNDFNIINSIYYKSCLNQFIIASFIFIGVWANIDNLYRVLPAGFEQGKWVIFFIMLANLSEMLTGLNGTIINTSKFYRASAFFIGLLVLMMIGVNAILIPLFGITGAAIGVFIANSSNSLVKYLFLYKKFKMNPLDKKFIFITLIAVFSYGITFFIPQIQSFMLDFIVRSSIITIVFVFLLVFFRISDEANSIFFKVVKILKNADS